LCLNKYAGDCLPFYKKLFISVQLVFKNITGWLPKIFKIFGSITGTKKRWLVLEEDIKDR
jgi:hypothetical protein